MIQHTHRTPETWLRQPLLLSAVLLGMVACTTVQPYKAKTPEPVVASTPSQPKIPETETQPVTPSAPMEPAQPLPPPTTRSYSLNAASRALVSQADAQRKAKNFPQAAATLERALRIEPNNPLLWLAYGELRMDEGNYAQAENMGRKAVASASGDPRTQSNAWRLIAESLRARNKNSEAQQADARASSLSGR